MTSFEVALSSALRTKRVRAGGRGGRGVPNFYSLNMTKRSDSYFKWISDSKGFSDIILPSEGEFIILGRSEWTGLKDPRISRRHLKLTRVGADTLEIQQLGRNSSFVIEGSVKRVLRRGQLIRIGISSIFKWLKKDTTRYQLSSSCNSVTQGRNTTVNMEKPSDSHWSSGLLQSMKDPSMVLKENDEFVIIKDKYPKSKHHFLASPHQKIPNLKALNKTHLKLLKRIHSQSREFVKEKYSDIDFRLGYHAVPSMSQIHCHIISQDFVSPHLKHKKHWNSFNTPYFINASAVLEELESEGKISADPEIMSGYLKRDLMCHKCEYTPKNMPDLKNHLHTHSF